MTKPTSKVKDRWNAKHYDRIYLRVSKGKKAEIQQIAGKNKLNEWIVDAIEKKLGR